MHNNKFFAFFTKSKILTEDEFLHLNQFCNFDYEIINDDVNIKIILDKPLEPKFYFYLCNLFDNYKDEVKIIFDLDLIKFEINDIFSFLKYYLSDNSDYVLVDIINRFSGEIIDDNLHIFYLNNFELEALEKSKENLFNFIISHFPKIKGLVFSFDQEKFNFIAQCQKESEKYIDEIIENNNNNESINKKNLVISTKKIDDIKNISINSKSAVIKGLVFKKEKIALKNNNFIYQFYVTDYSDSILIRAFSKNKSNYNNTLEKIEENDWIIAKINLAIDEYRKNDLVGNVTYIEIVDQSKNKQLENINYNRIEFINHTKMTAFEGLVDLDEIFKFYNDNKLQHLFITDKFNCQSFPEAYNISKKYSNINLHYGFQTYLCKDDDLKIVANEQKINLSKASYVIFDIETTGLYPLEDKLIEFGAIKYENGIIVEKKQFFINPEQELSAKTINLTRITQEQVNNGYDQLSALNAIKDFFSDSILIAHNGINFDLSFLNKKLEQYNQPIIKNPLIDTMQLSRVINTNFKRHSLGYICHKYKINYNDEIAHRADFDAEVLLEVWKNMYDQLIDINVVDLDKLNYFFDKKIMINKISSYLPLVTIYAKNQEGIKSLYKLISLSLTKNYFSNSVLFWSDLLNHRENILITNAPSESDIMNYALSKLKTDLNNVINKYDFILLPSVSCFDHEVSRLNLSSVTIEKAYKLILDLANKNNKKVIVSGNNYYLNQYDQQIFDVYVHTKSIGGKPHRLYSYKDTNSVLPKYHFRSCNELYEEFKFLDKNVAKQIIENNANEIINLFENNLVPVKFGLHSPKIENANEMLENLVMEKMKEKYGDNVDPSIIKRIKFELKSIINNGYAVIYWFAHLLVKKSIDDGYPVGSRGSVGSSLVATLINITDVNPLPAHYLCENCKYFEYVSDVQSGFDLPIKNCPNCEKILIGEGHNIPFETFMGFDGDKVPDIDLNFSAEYQAKAHDFIKEMFGSKHVLRAGTISTVAEKTAIGYVKNYLEQKEMFNMKQAHIIWMAKRCQDVKRTTGQHPGGIIVVPQEYEANDFTPYNYPADDTSQNWYTTHFAFEYLHDSLLKFDILGHDTPTFLKTLKKTTNIDPLNIPNYDKNVIEMFNDASVLSPKLKDIFKVGTIGIPEFWTNFVQEMLEITNPKCFSDLVRISGLSHGTDVWIGNAKNLIENYGISISDVICCRDDIMNYLIKKGIEPIASFKIMESVRKGKKIPNEYLESLRKNNIPEWYIESCNKIKYVFPKAHATAYVLMSWKIAWYKFYYPINFYSAYLSIKINAFDLKAILLGADKIKENLLSIRSRLSNYETKNTVSVKENDLLNVYEIVYEMYARGFTISNIDINRSEISEFIIDNNVLIPPFIVIDGLGESIAKSIVDARNEKKFSSKSDLLERTKINKNHYYAFLELGILNDLSEDDQLSLFEI